PNGSAAPSRHFAAPVVQEMTPAVHLFALPEQAWPAVHGTQAPLPSQTRLVPQLAPALRKEDVSPQLGAPEQERAPTRQASGLPVQVAPGTQVPQNPLLQRAPPSQVVPLGALAALSVHTGVPVEHCVAPTLHAFELPV